MKAEDAKRLRVLHDIATGTVSMYGSADTINAARDELIAALPSLLALYDAVMGAEFSEAESDGFVCGYVDEKHAGQRVRLVPDCGEGT